MKAPRRILAVAGITLVGAVLNLDVSPNPAVAQYIAPETVLARVTGPTLVNGSLYASCRLDAGYGKTLFLLRCGVKRLDQHWYGDSERVMWQTTTYAVMPHQKVIIGTHAGFRCEHGKRYQAWAYGQSTGFASVEESSAKTSYRTYC